MANQKRLINIFDKHSKLNVTCSRHDRLISYHLCSHEQRNHSIVSRKRLYLVSKRYNQRYDVLYKRIKIGEEKEINRGR